MWSRATHITVINNDIIIIVIIIIIIIINIINSKNVTDKFILQIPAHLMCLFILM
jgi:hypothetical protein